jgi:hypothetical protein
MGGLFALRVPQFLVPSVLREAHDSARQFHDLWQDS